MIYTSYFSKVKALCGINPHLTFISIAGKTPMWFDNSLINVLKYPKLAPKYEWWNVWHKKFNECLESDESQRWYTAKYYETVLDCLNPIVVRKELLDLSNRKDVVLLCYETPERFCHRKLVREWFNSVKIECKEI
jgi:uncharacterized protein (DUF488 family)